MNRLNKIKNAINICAYCNQEITCRDQRTIDHIIPKSKRR
jgi:hypothetical protein